MTFLIIHEPAVYNVIIGQPTIIGLKAITSVYHLMMKFPTEEGVAHMMGDQAMARICYVRAVDSKKVVKEEEHNGKHGVPTRR